MNGFRKLQQRLREEGWSVGWNLPCCQSCAWDELPDTLEDGTDIDFSKVLFNHSQDCETEFEFVDCDKCEGTGCDFCEWVGANKVSSSEGEFDTSVSGFVCFTPEQQSESTFCFDGSKQGVKNLKAIIPIIEECGCKVHWNGKGDTRPDIGWETA
jgi:hypothetical protein